MLKHKVGDVVWIKVTVEEFDKESKHYPYKVSTDNDEYGFWLSTNYTIAKDSEIVYTKSEEFEFGDNVVVTVGVDSVVGKFVTYTEIAGLEVTVLCNDGKVRHYDKEYVSHG